MRNRQQQLTPGVDRHVAVAVCRATAVSVALAACFFQPAPAADGGSLVREIQLTPAGAFAPSDGREMPVDAWRIDAAIASRVIERFNARKNPAVLDYEHATLRVEETGEPALAAGWIQSLQWREGSGLWATVELTARAAGYVDGNELRYVSPVFIYDTDTGEVLAITMAALTNNPALDGMAPLEARAAATFGFHHDSTETSAMNPLFLALCALLGLDSDKTTEDQAVAACNALKPRLDALGKILPEIGAGEIKDDASANAAVAACTALKQRAQDNTPDPAKFVPVSVVESIKTDLAALKAQQVDREVGELVDGAIADGRLLEAQKTWATDLGKTNLAALKSYIETAQPIAALRGTQTAGRQPAGTKDENGLTQEELAVCSMTGVSPKDYAAAKPAQASA